MLAQSKSIVTIFLHGVAYYIAWLSCILFAAHGNGWAGPVIVLLLLIVQCCWQIKIKATRHLWLFVLILTVLGTATDWFMIQQGLIVFEAGVFGPQFPPLWEIAIWINFSVVLYACLRHYFDYYWTFAVLALFGFPLAFWCGGLLGAATFPQHVVGIAMTGIIWTILLPSTLLAFHHLFGDYDVKTSSA